MQRNLSWHFTVRLYAIHLCTSPFAQHGRMYKQYEGIQLSISLPVRFLSVCVYVIYHITYSLTSPRLNILLPSGFRVTTKMEFYSSPFFFCMKFRICSLTRMNLVACRKFPLWQQLTYVSILPKKHTRKGSCEGRDTKLRQKITKTIFRPTVCDFEK